MSDSTPVSRKRKPTALTRQRDKLQKQEQTILITTNKSHVVYGIITTCVKTIIKSNQRLRLCEESNKIRNGRGTTVGKISTDVHNAIKDFLKKKDCVASISINGSFDDPPLTIIDIHISGVLDKKVEFDRYMYNNHPLVNYFPQDV